jgi:hypothetical protein
VGTLRRPRTWTGHGERSEPRRRQEHLKDMEREQKDARSGERRRPVDSIGKANQNLKHGLKKIQTAADAPED